MTEAGIQPEELVRSAQIFDGKIFKVRVDTVKLPDGREAVREVVRHRPAAVVLPIDAQGNVLLVRQYRYAVGKVLLEAPAGLMEESEAPQDTAQRELQEETGYLSRDLHALGGFWTGPGFCDEYIYAYLAKDLVPSDRNQDPDENIQVERMPLARVMQLARDGTIEDAKTLAVLHLAATNDGLG